MYSYKLKKHFKLHSPKTFWYCIYKHLELKKHFKLHSPKTLLTAIRERRRVKEAF